MGACDIISTPLRRKRGRYAYPMPVIIFIFGGRQMKFGFIGAGRMAEAILSGLISKGVSSPSDIYATDISEKLLDEIRSKYEITAIPNGPSGNGIAELLSLAEVIFLAVKPQYAASILRDAGKLFTPRHTVISIMGGVSTDTIEAYIPSSPVVRVMPNTPMLVCEGAAGICAGKSASREHAELALNLFSKLGRAYALPEALMNPLTGVSGCGPAFVYMLIEALADGGVFAGLPRDIALELAAQTVIGAGKMALETGRHPGVLKDEVCSPGGATIAGVASLEASGFRGAVIGAVSAAVERMGEVGRKNM